MAYRAVVQPLMAQVARCLVKMLGCRTFHSAGFVSSPVRYAPDLDDTVQLVFGADAFV